MKAEDLIDILITLPGDTKVCIAERKTEFKYGLVNSAYMRKVDFTDEPSGEIMDSETILILDEE